jgi:Zn-dependent protease
MFRHTISIGRIFGIEIDLDHSWFLIVGLLTWLLAVAYFPEQYHDWSRVEYWVVGAATAVMLFVSVLIHELGHSVVAKSYGLAVPRITLFIFGGVSQIAAEPPSAAAEFWIAVIGPLVSFALALIFWELTPALAWYPPLSALSKYLALINLVLGVFNLVPGFPLDGGRVFRAIVWKITGKYEKATVVAGVTGRFFGFLMIFWGVWAALSGRLLDGLWIAFIGWFLESAAGSQLQLEVVKNVLGEHKVLDVMKRDFPQVPGSRYFVVDKNGDPAGMVTVGSVRESPRAAWGTTTVSQIMTPFRKLHTIDPNARLWSAFERMGRDGVNQLPVVDPSGIVGILSRDDILHYLSMLRAFSR